MQRFHPLRASLPEKTWPAHARAAGLLFVCGVACGLSATPAWADVTLFDRAPVRIDGYLEIGGGGFYVPDVNFGAGSYATANGKGLTRWPSYGELYMKPGLTGRVDLGGGTSVFAGLSAIGSVTFGHGDAELYSQTSGTPSSVALEESYLGVDTHLPFGGANDTFQVKGGRQRFMVDDGFLIGKGTYNTGERAAWWYAPRFAFSGPGTMSFNGNPVRADVFVLENNSSYADSRGDDRPATSFAGFDVTWYKSKPGKDGRSIYANRAAYVTLTYFNVYNADSSSYFDRSVRGDRDGMNVYSLSFGGTMLPVHMLGIDKNLTLYGQYVGEHNDNKAQGWDGVDAYGLYIESGYTFSGVPWTPRIFYRYSNYSGNKSANSTVKHSYDNMFLFNGARRVFGGNFPGEIVGEYTAGLSNINIHQAGVTVTPPVHVLRDADSTDLSLLYYSINYNHPEAAGLTAADSHFSDEVDAVAEYSYDDSTSGALLAGIAFPGRGGKDTVISQQPAENNLPHVGRTSYVFETYFYKRF